jgi:hypothetical protein
MRKFNAGWIVLIVFCSLIIIGGFFYLLYRLYINHIYKRKRAWYEITSPLKMKIDDSVICLIPRQSISPLIQEFLPNEFKKQPVQRKMVTQLQFDEPPLFVKNLTEEWDEMNTKSTFCSSFYRLFKMKHSRLVFIPIDVYSNIISYNCRTQFL